ncbi:MAG: protein kinase [Anaerolineae bacterium]
MTDNSSQNKNTTDSQRRMQAELEHEYQFDAGNLIAGRYRVNEPIGFGGFAEVYRCQDTQLKREVAIKVLTNENATLEDEALTAAQLNHPNIVQVYDIASLKEDDTPIIVLEYIKGETLEKQINQAKYRRLTLDSDTLTMIEQVGNALDYAHQQGVIHRDIKPSNILIDTNQTPYLTDFGLAHIEFNNVGQSMLSADVRKNFSGTIPYMSPEQLLEKTEGDRLTDIYAFGVMIYEMLTGRLPYHGRDAGLILDIANEEALPLPPSEANAELPANLNDVLLKAFQYKPEERYESAEKFIVALKGVADEFSQANSRYQEAIQFVEQQDWHKAKEILDQLPLKFKEVPLYREQADHQVSLLNLLTRAKNKIEEKDFVTALATLESLNQVDPEFDVEKLRDMALKGISDEDKRTLQQQYDEAVAYFNDEEYQAALDKLDVIKQKDSNYADPKQIRQKAQNHVDHQNTLRQLYNKGVEYSQQEEWDAALSTFEELSAKDSGYEDVSTRLVSLKHFSELAGLLSKAKALEKAKEFADAIDQIDQIKNKNPNYQESELADYRQKLVDQLYERCQKQLASKNYADCLTSIAQLNDRAKGYAGSSKLEAQAKQGLADEQKLAYLRQQYETAEAHVVAREYEPALEIWQQIETQKEGLPFGDERNLRHNIKEGLYSEATTAVSNEQPAVALALWQTLYDFDPSYEDRNKVVEKAKGLIERQELRRKARWVGSVVGALILLILFGWFFSDGFFNGGNGPSEASITQTAIALIPDDISTQTPEATNTSIPASTTVQIKPSATIKPTSTKVAVSATSTKAPASSPTATRTQTATPIVTKTSTSTPTHTKTPTRTPTPATETARVAQPITLFAGPGENYEQFRFIDSGETVEVIGRSANNSWLHIEFENRKGWVATNRMTYNGRVSDLPISTVQATPVSSTPIVGVTPIPGSTEITGLTFDFWDLPGNSSCNSGSWEQELFMAGQGNSGIYTYFIDGVQVGGPTSDSMVYKYQGSGGGNVGVVGRVVASSGQSRDFTLIFPAPCG